jgi:hypothetical protein
MSDDDKLLNYAILIVRDARAGKLDHDPAVAMQALMHLLETTGGLWKEYQSLLKVELKRLPQSERPIRKRNLRDAKARANAAATAACCDERETAEAPRPRMKIVLMTPAND